jgi:thiol-disulfide isomerase/thioredoxin
VALVPVTAADVMARVAASRGRPVLVNVWATWCAPCREEFPDLVRLERELSAEGFRLLLVSADFDTEVESVRRFLAEQGVDFETYLKQEDDLRFIDGLHKEWTGALPASFLFDGSGRLHRSWEGKASYDDLRAAIVSLLEQGGARDPNTGGEES